LKTTVACTVTRKGISEDYRTSHYANQTDYGENNGRGIEMNHN
jgi:hypothetical protein